MSIRQNARVWSNTPIVFKYSPAPKIGRIPYGPIVYNDISSILSSDAKCYVFATKCTVIVLSSWNKGLWLFFLGSAYCVHFPQNI